MKYPKLAAAIDEVLARLVQENGEDFITMAVVSALNHDKEPMPEKLPPIPTTKEVVDGD